MKKSLSPKQPPAMARLLFGLANAGLSGIIKFPLPILPLTSSFSISLILLSIATYDRPADTRGTGIIMAFVGIGAVLDTLGMMPELTEVLHLPQSVTALKAFIPLAGYG